MNSQEAGASTQANFRATGVTCRRRKKQNNKRLILFYWVRLKKIHKPDDKKTGKILTQTDSFMPMLNELCISMSTFEFHTSLTCELVTFFWAMVHRQTKLEINTGFSRLAGFNFASHHNSDRLTVNIYCTGIHFVGKRSCGTSGWMQRHEWVRGTSIMSFYLFIYILEVA